MFLQHLSSKTIQREGESVEFGTKSAFVFGFSANFLIHCKDREYLFTIFVYYLYCLLALGTMENKKLGKVVGGKRGADEIKNSCRPDADAG